MAPVNTRSTTTKSPMSENTADQGSGVSEDNTCAASQTGEMASDIAKIYQLLQKMSDQQDSKLNDIKRVTDSMDAKLTDLTGRLDSIEGRLGFLEDAEEARKADPPASCSELEALRSKVDEIENRERRCNLRCFGFLETYGKDDMVSFITATLPQMLDLDFPGGLQVERCHRVGKTRPDGKPPRYIIVRFTRFPDKERIKEKARELGRQNVTWEGNQVWFHDDYSQIEDAKQRQFKECRQLLFDKHKVKSYVNYPATLKFKKDGVVKLFRDPKQALSFIKKM